MIKITVSGRPGSGKSCVTFAIQYYLKLCGFEVMVSDAYGDQSRPAEIQYKALHAIAGHTVVEIYTTQESRNG